jgi:LmbE family N-acetylglucosaminyl deacetylase
MKSLHEYVEKLSALADEASSLAAPQAALYSGPIPAEDAPRVLICSPHPDDECITGVLPLRLMRECDMRVVNLAITLGSNVARRAGRRSELTNACGYLGWDLVVAGQDGLERITPKARATDDIHWADAVETVAAIISEQAPRVLVFPHEKDWNGTHEGVNLLVLDALAELGTSIDVYVVETEFWHPMDFPNMMVEADTRTVGDLVAATSLHVGEVVRNPYHLLLPGWMQDNVRRGGEKVGGQGGAAPQFRFSTLYRVRKWEGGALREVLDSGRFVGMDADLAPHFA